jgi:formate dehydrogenase subunit delta
VTGTVPPQIRQANEIAAQFRYLPPEQGAAEVAKHIRMFWDPRMRADLHRHLHEEPEELDPLALEAAKLLE